MKSTRTRTIAICLILSIPPLIGFSQEAPPDKVAKENRGTFLTIPSGPVRIIDKDFRQFVGTIVDRDEEGITVIKQSDRKKYHVKWDDLDPNLVPLFKGVITFEEEQKALFNAEDPRTVAHDKKKAEEEAVRIAAEKKAQEEREAAEWEEARKQLEEIGTARQREAEAERKARYEVSQAKRKEMMPTYQKMSASEIQTLIKEKDPDLMLAFDGAFTSRYQHTHEMRFMNHPTQLAYFATIEIKPNVDEKVSLHPSSNASGSAPNNK